MVLTFPCVNDPLVSGFAVAAVAAAAAAAAAASGGMLL